MPRPDHFPAEGWLVNISAGGDPEFEWIDDREIAETFEDRQHYVLAREQRKVTSALKEPARLRVIEVLALWPEPESTAEIAQRLSGGVKEVAYHLGVLLDAGLVETAYSAHRGGTIENFYRLAGG